MTRVMAGRRGRGPTLAVVGAGGLVGSLLVPILSLRQFAWGEVRLLASERSAGRSVPVRGRRQSIHKVEESSFHGADVVVFATPTDVSMEWVPLALKAGAIVVDGSGAHAQDPDVPVVVPAVNAGAARDRSHRLLSVPGGMTTTLSEALAALHAQWGLEEVVVSTYEPASSFGTAGVNRLRDEMLAVVESAQGSGWLGQRAGDVRAAVGAHLGDHESPFAAPLALNVVPLMGPTGVGGWSEDEVGLIRELRRVLGLPNLAISPTRVLVPVVTGHCASVHVTCQKRLSVSRVRQIFIEAPDIVVVEDAVRGVVPTPVDVAGSDPAFVGRLRQNPDRRNEIDFFLAGDNVRRGTALALLKVAEMVASRD